MALNGSGFMDNYGPSLDAVSGTFLASTKSVGTAMAMAGVGAYLHRREFLASEGKRTLALISQQVTFPLFLFSKILFCNQDWSSEPCPDVTQSLKDVWMLLFWPIYVVSVGCLVGWMVVKVSGTKPGPQTRSVMAAIAFGNSTGLPITLLTVVHTNFPDTVDIGRIDPTLFLSVYLLLYPVLQWGMGGWLLAPSESDDDEEEEENVEEDNSDDELLKGEATDMPTRLRHSEHWTLLRNVVNNKTLTTNHRRLTSTDEGMYISDADLPALVRRWNAEEEEDKKDTYPQVGAAGCPPFSPDEASEGTPLMMTRELAVEGTHAYYGNQINTDITRSAPGRLHSSSVRSSAVSVASDFDAPSLCETLSNVMERCLQPPVVGSLFGIFCAVTPLRGIFVDIEDRNSDAPLQWLFDGLYAVGQAAVPINMIILGCNLSASVQSLYNKTVSKGGGEGNVAATTGTATTSTGLLPFKTTAGIIVGKMIVMPLVGILTGALLKTYVLSIPEDIDGAFYLVLMIVFITPTANNVMVMVELSGGKTKEGIAMCIAAQYAIAPVVLSLTMTVAIGVASGWS